MLNYEQKFINNVKKLRRENGLTQKAFAEKLGYSEKTISKWECAGCIPNVETLYKIASIFKVKIDDLFCDSEVYFLGIDGGGTKTALALSSSDLTVIKRLYADCCNPIDIGIDECKKTLKNAIYEICEGVSFSSIVCFAGISGGSSAGMKDKLNSFFGEFNFLAYSSDTDNKNIISAGLNDKDGVTVIMGTGVCVFSSIQGKLKRFGGWGYLFDDKGCSFNIAKDGLTAHFAGIDGSGERTLLSTFLQKEYPDEQALLGKLYKGGKKFISSFSPLVYKSAEGGDLVCKKIIKDNMRYVANLIKTAIKDFDFSPVPVIIAGGLTSHPLTLKELGLALEGDSRVNLKVLSCEPVLGALMLAKKLYLKELGEI